MKDAGIQFVRGNTNVHIVRCGDMKKLQEEMGTKSMEILKITKNCIVPKENINLITDYKSRPIINRVKEKKEKGLCFNLAGNDKINSVIFLKTEEIITTNTLVETLLARMEEKGS